MLRGLYTASSGMIAQQKIMDVLSNNLANVNTTGYKKDSVVTSAFPGFMVTKSGGDNVPYDGNVGRMNYGILVDTFNTNFSEGAIQETKGKLDFAIDGTGFFEISTPQGMRYTRDGSFTLNSNGYLVTKDGYNVMGQNGPIRLTEGDISVDNFGNITLNGQNVDRLNIVDFNNYNTLRKEGNNLFFNVGGQAIPSNATIKQGYLEGSNVNSVDEMVNMINVMRIYEANQKIALAFDETLDKAVNEVGRV
ncbi:flagellar basal-body rod protein FlgF [Thermoanaerobacterium sp. RBIITD]|uniref:flagellar basal-body rod protein FlgF n=1 Tax=Thermoanaerobacterium sp. RBIITD TaxID=1550240 RepID=UPI000BB871B4|nr:flagellar basal-body rod protein FlgF [Thermoanaerobacterium sp. RBIITD]SNX53535.1 flagellar basal-body rod protein FlgG [Thermoanaerobacterium sp. RBIITD]